MFNGSRRVDAVTENYATRMLIFARVLAILLHEHLQGLNFVEVADLDELVLKVAQIHVSALLHEDVEVGIVWVEEARGHFFHPFVDRGSAHHELGPNISFGTRRQMLLNNLTDSLLVPRVKKGIQLVYHQRTQVRNEQFFAISSILQPFQSRNKAVNSLI